MTRPVGRPAIGTKTSITLSAPVRAALQRSGGLSTVAREVLERWATGQGFDVVDESAPSPEPVTTNAIDRMVADVQDINAELSEVSQRLGGVLANLQALRKGDGA